MRHSCLRAIPVVLMLIAGLAGPGCDLQHSGSPGAPGVVAHTPVPTPAGPVVIYGCGLPRGSGDGHDCGREEPHYSADVASAMNTVIENNGNWFEGNRIRDEHVTAYHEAVAAALISRGFCALFDGEEIALKRTNDFSEQYDIARTPPGGGFLIWDPPGHMATCRPAWSAIPPAGNGS